MLANRVKETTTTAGAGNLTLVGAVTNFQTFNTAFGLVPRFYYWIIDSTNDAWETGVGYLSATTTLVRETVLDNSSGTQVALTLGAGTKDVFCAPPENGTVVNSPYSYHAAEPSGHLLIDRSTIVLSPSREYYMPYLARGGAKFANISVNVTIAAAAAIVARMGLYNIGSDGLPAAKIAETATFLVDTTGLKTVSIALPTIAGWYYAAIISDGTPRVTATVANMAITSMYAGAANFGSDGYAWKTGSGAVLPDPAVITSGTTGTAPVLGLST